jgi:diacylglycerol kinase family enzyme
MPSMLLLANPAASGFTGGLHRDVVMALRERYDIETAWPQSPDDARAQASAAVIREVDVVVAMGGDGVVHHVANGLVGTPTALGIIPAGTTNVVARILGIPHKPLDAAKRLASDGEITPVPVAALQTTAPSGSSDKRIAVFSAGVGVDAEVVEVAEQEPFRKYSFGSVHYARTAASVIWSRFRDRRPNLRVEAPGRTADAVSVFVQIHDMYSYLGRAPLRLGDHVPGTLSALVVHELPPQRAIRVVAGALRRRGVGDIDGVELWSDISQLSITAEPAAGLQADGEHLGDISHTLIHIASDELLVAT